MRITTNAILRNYKNSLSASINNLSSSRTRVLTQRSFNSVAENASAAAKASQLQRKYTKNQDNLNMIDDAQARLDGQEAAMMQVNTVLTTIAENYNVSVMNGTNGSPEVLQTYATAIRGYMETIVSDLNASYADTYLFAGADGNNPPFALSDNGTLTYRGIDVNAAEGTEDYETLKELANESLYVDIGLGLTIDNNGEVVPSSAFDVSLSGIKVTGYGLDEDGDSKNVINLAGQLADLLEAETFDSDAYGKLMDKFKALSDGFSNNVTELGVKSEFLTTTEDRLENLSISLQAQLENVEGIDLEAAYTDYAWYQYAYTAALKVGTSILSSSFIDFMS